GAVVRGAGGGASSGELRRAEAAGNQPNQPKALAEKPPPIAAQEAYEQHGDECDVDGIHSAPNIHSALHDASSASSPPVPLSSVSRWVSRSAHTCAAPRESRFLVLRLVAPDGALDGLVLLDTNPNHASVTPPVSGMPASTECLCDIRVLPRQTPLL